MVFRYWSIWRTTMAKGFSKYPSCQCLNKSNLASHRPAKFYVPYKKPRIEIINNEEGYFTVPDPGWIYHHQFNIINMLQHKSDHTLFVHRYAYQLVTVVFCFLPSSLLFVVARIIDLVTELIWLHECRSCVACTKMHVGILWLHCFIIH